MSGMLFVKIAVGGAIGALARYGMSGAIYAAMGARLPWGTLFVNLLGCFLLGALMEISRLSAWVSPDTRLAIGIGFLGSFTTFSTFGVETFRAIEAGSWSAAVWNVLLNVVGGLFFVILGVGLARGVIHLRSGL